MKIQTVYRVQVVTPPVSDSVGQGQNPRICISDKSPGDAEASWVHGGGRLDERAGYTLRITR